MGTIQRTLYWIVALSILIVLVREWRDGRIELGGVREDERSNLEAISSGPAAATTE
jgi:hypothetical protein